MNNRYGLNSLYDRSDVPSYSMSRPDTEVPSYGLGAILSSIGNTALNLGTKAVSGLGNLATKAGSAIAGGASSIGNAVSKIPLVGNVVGGSIGTLGNGVGQLVSGNIGGGLSSLYTGADKLLGGFLPNIPGAAAGSTLAGIAPAQGWMSSLYNAGDKALGGYLPNFGGGFGAASPSGGLGSLFGGGGGGAAGGGMSGWDKAATAAQMLQAGAGIYGMLKPQGNAGAYQQSAGPQVQPVLLGAGGGGGGGVIGAPASTGLVNASDPALSAGGGGGNVPTIAQATGGAAISDIGVKKNGEDLSKALNNLNKNKTQQVAEGGLGIDIA